MLGSRCPNPPDLQGVLSICFLDSMSTLAFLLGFSWAWRNNSKASVVPSVAIQSAASYRRLTVWNPRTCWPEQHPSGKLTASQRHIVDPTKSGIWQLRSWRLKTASSLQTIFPIQATKQADSYRTSLQDFTNRAWGSTLFKLHFTGQLKQLWHSDLNTEVLPFLRCHHFSSSGNQGLVGVASNWAMEMHR